MQCLVDFLSSSVYRRFESEGIRMGVDENGCGKYIVRLGINDEYYCYVPGTRNSTVRGWGCVFNAN